jgi:hypothetical protein
MMEAIRSFETSVLTGATRRNIPEEVCPCCALSLLPNVCRAHINRRANLTNCSKCVQELMFILLATAAFVGRCQ